MKRRAFRDHLSVNPTEPLAIEPSAFFLFFFGNDAKPNERRGPVTILNVSGPLEQRAGWFDGYDAIVDRFREALADESETIVMRIDSPGGACAGCFEAVRTMRELAASSSKRIIAYADEGAYSAAYAISCVASELYLPESGGVGSIGVITAMVDRTAQNKKDGRRVVVVHAGARKADGHPDVEMTDDAVARVQARVDGLASIFHELVSEARPLSVGAVASLEADSFYGEEAIEAGLADGVTGFAALLEELGATDETDDTDPGASPTEGDPDMKIKSNLAAVNANATDVLSSPLVQGADGRPTPVGASAAPVAKEESEESSEDSEEEEDEEESEESEDPPSDKEGEDEEESSEESEEESSDEESEDEEEEEEASTPEVAPRVARGTAATSRDVLAFVRELTGEASVAGQIGALTAIKDRIAKVGKLEARNAKLTKDSRKASVTTKVDAAIRAGKLTPAQRAWAIETGVESPKTLDGYLKASKPIVKPAQLRGTKEKAPKGSKGQTAVDADGLTPEERAVAATLQVDPSKLAEHKRTARVH